MPETEDDRRRFAWWLALLTVAAAAARIAGLSTQQPLGDDLSAGVSAINFIERSQIGPTMWQHPRLRDLLIYLSVSLLGPSKLGLALPSLLLGILGIPAAGLLARRLGGNRAGLLAALWLAIDPLHIDYSRQAVQEAYTAFFGAAGVYATLRYLDTRRGGWSVAAGTLFGLGLASKWSVAFPLAIMLAWGCWRVAREPTRHPALRRADLGLVLAALGVLPAAVYLATWAPWFAGGRDLSDWVHLQGAMIAEATSHAGFNVADREMPHRALLWFLWPVYYADSTFGPSGPIPIVAISNPLTWLATLPAVVWLASAARRARDPERALLPVLVVATWLPFAVASRPIWLHSALAVLPFALAAASLAATDLAERTPHGRRLLAAYAVLAVVLAAPLYVMATGLAPAVPGLREITLRFRPASTIWPDARP
jgi:4-amino-4-deoxy-L-arabinose transferase-like glycosyltransferase